MFLYEWDKKVGLTIQALRTVRGIRQFVLADALNMDQSTISRMENGEISISCGQLQLMAQEIGVTIFELFKVAEVEFSSLQYSNTEHLAKVIWASIKAKKLEEEKDTISIHEIEYCLKLFKSHIMAMKI